MSQMQAVVDKLLTNVSIGYFPDGYISEDALPALPVDQQTGLLGKYNPLQHLRAHVSTAGGRGEARRVEPIRRDASTGYAVVDHALESVLTPSDYRNVELPFQLEQDEILGLTASIYLEKELALAAQLTSTSVMTQNTTLSGTSQFSDFVNSDPITQFITAMNAVRDGSGMVADTVGMDWKVAQTLRYHPQLWDRLGLKFNQNTPMTDAQLCFALGVDRVLIAKPMYNSAVEGQSDSLSSIWGKHIWFGVLPKSPQLRQVSLGYYIHYRNEKPRKVYRYPIYNPANSTGLQVLDSYQFKITNAAAGYLIYNAIA